MDALSRRSAAGLLASTVLGGRVAVTGAATGSAAASALPVRRLAYGPDPLQHGELRLPEGAGPHPVVVLLHGGFWQAPYGLDQLVRLAETLTARLRVATWNVEYRRVGDAGGGFPGTFLDAGAAADHLRTVANEHRLDLSRVVALGHSAGGHLAHWLAGRARIAPASPLHRPEPLRLCGVVSLAGVTNLAHADRLHLGGGAVRRLMGGSPSELPDRYAAGDPAALLPTGVPQVLLHGDADHVVLPELSRDYVALATRKGDEARLVPLRGAGHFEPIDPATPEFVEVAQAVRRLVYQPSRRGASGA